ncbi:hypothetical protein D9619_012224 [Psilocybe cf. subviscida]|uniref:Uncharacterized protein n=1 Tax=Psilocybe cf. subviscida TaxID=2480587 RepID=A0A8H5B8D8_9AGAR|nr:hypothetical protein D9619_012224 [Psilocybe cf. subviscida]
MVHNYGMPGLLSGTHSVPATATILREANISNTELDARVASFLLRNEPQDYSRVSMHDLLSFFNSYETCAPQHLAANTPKVLSKPTPVSVVQDSKWKSIEYYTDSFRNVPPVVLQGILSCIGVPTDKFLSCYTSGELVDALFSELITRAFPNLDTEGSPRDVEQDILKIKNFVWMYEMSGTKISTPGISPNASKVPDAGVVERFTSISKIVHYLGMKEIQSIGQSLRCMAIGQTRIQLANEFLVNLGYQAMHQGNDLIQALKVVQGYCISPTNMKT